MRDDVVLALVGASASDRYCSRLFSGRQLWCADDLCYQLQETAVGRIAKFVPACRAVTGTSRSAVIAVYATPIDGHYEVPLWVARTFDRVLSRAGIVLPGAKHESVSAIFLSILACSRGNRLCCSRARDISDPSFLGNPPGPYPNSNIVGTFISVSFERTTPVSEPNALMLVLAGLVALRLMHRPARQTQA